jgi:hypothetical protein
MILLSTCLNDDFDADDIMESSSSSYKHLRYMFSIVFFVISLPAAGFPPYFGLLLSCSSLAMCLPSFNYYYYDKFTFKLCAYMLGWVVMFAWAFLWGGIIIIIIIIIIVIIIIIINIVIIVIMIIMIRYTIYE